MFNTILDALYKYKNFEEFYKNNAFELIEKLLQAWHKADDDEYQKIQIVLKHFANIFISEKIYTPALDIYNIQIDFFLENYDHEKLQETFYIYNTTKDQIIHSLKISTPILEPVLSQFQKTFLVHMRNSFKYINKEIKLLFEGEQSDNLNAVAILNNEINLQTTQLEDYLTCMYLSFEKLFDKTKVQSLTDDLTQLHNRRYLFQHYMRYFLLASRLEMKLSIILMDLDKFKRVNDTYGHHKGDEVLRKVAEVIRYSFRKSDFKIRIGGDEFVILLFENNLINTKKIAEDILDKINALKFISDSGEIFHVGASIGITINTMKNVRKEQNSKAHFEAMLKEADNAMYYSKTHDSKVTIYSESIKTIK